MPERIVAALLCEWRNAERELLAARPRDRVEAQRRVDSLRTAYHEAARALEELQAHAPPSSWASVEGQEDRTAPH